MNYSPHDPQISHIHIHPYSPRHSDLYVPHFRLGHSALINQLKSWRQKIKTPGSRSKNASVLRLYKLSPALKVQPELKERETAEHLGVMPNTPLSGKPL